MVSNFVVRLPNGWYYCQKFNVFYVDHNSVNLNECYKICKKWCRIDEKEFMEHAQVLVYWCNPIPENVPFDYFVNDSMINERLWQLLGIGKSQCGYKPWIASMYKNYEDNKNGEMVTRVPVDEEKVTVLVRNGLRVEKV
ncbi:hypothetical protein [Phthorimaea operculella granulovirus]|uniref:Uncharacterized protein n=1 Tax=Phthorimaea operculella granulovirus TaxID=192584 RepID=Q8JS03_9BBAC|nr:hypothetical protein [Phthorimaea operculella granulovirus]AAM70254.1 hypothetical protein [Phthorimaea operculella granulovirus]ANY57445.1 hypothetical protein PhopGVgp056 [Phthorimaea operculella granulovirus]QBH65891.1 hypothetical protein PhopGVgp056 [Phthorimaea operculella granulovirus]QBH66021.1 hypothetical protein PhopGVgp056 [Phthorimaea operculella granulovirus]QBH66151.1 hypothetical protein PhopGVgp056 [Phthorimaea operculella granulovirus]